jgi:hypothetical protein
MELSNRETATLMWMAVIAAAILLYKPLHSSLKAVIKALFRRVFAIVFGLAALYIVASVTVLSWIGIWSPDNLNTTFVWALTFAAVAIFDANRIDEDRTYFRKTIRDTISFTALLVFIVELNSFGLVAELLIIPIMAFLSLMNAAVNDKPEHRQVRGCVDALIICVGLGLLTYSLIETVKTWEAFDVRGNMGELFIPIFLSLMFLPFLYALSVYMVYERVFGGLTWALKNKGLRRFAKWRVICEFGPNLPLLKRWRNIVMRRRPETKLDIIQSIVRAKTEHERAKKPPVIDIEDGWSPYAAMSFLDTFEFEMDGYHWLYDRYRASSKMLKFRDSYPQNSVTYYVEGTELHATELTLEINVADEERENEDQSKFVQMISALLQKSVGAKGIDAFIRALSDEKIDTEVDCDGYQISLKNREWDNLKEYELAFVIKHPKNALAEG